MTPRLADMARVGVELVSRYRGVVATVWAVQLFFSVVAGWLISWTISSQANQTQALEYAVADDLTAMLMIASNAPHTLWFAIGSIASVCALYLLLTWFLAGGTIAVLVRRPYRRSEIMETFGAGGARAWFRFLRLAVVAVPLYLGSLCIAAAGALLALRLLGDAVLLDSSASIIALLGALPGLGVLLAVTTAVDYARIDIVRHPELKVARALLRSLQLVATRLRPSVHGGVYWCLFAVVTLIYAWAGPKGGALTTVPFLVLMAARIGVTGLRQCARIALIAGQVEFAQLSVFPPSADVVDQSEDEGDR